MRIKYLDEEMVFDCKPDGIMVIDVDVQGLMETDKIGKRIKLECPEVFKEYKRLITLNKIDCGDVFIYNHNKFKIALLCTTYHKVGQFKDQESTIKLSTERAIMKLMSRLEGDTKIYSGPLNRHTDTWNTISAWIIKAFAEKNHEWVVMRD